MEPIANPLGVVVGRHEADGWRVGIMRGGETILLSAEEARALGDDLIRMADVCDGRWE